MTSPVRACVSFCVLSLLLGVSPVLAGQAPSGAPAAAPGQPAAADADALSTQATDPTAFLPTLSFIGDVRTAFHDVEDSGFEFRFQPVVPYFAWGTTNILRLIVPYQAAGPGNDGLKAVSVVNLTVLSQSWGRWIVGPVMSLEQSDSDKDSKFSIGPAIGAIAPVSSTLMVGVFNQNLFATGVGITQIQPIFAYQLGSGWALSLGDLQLIYDWNKGEWVSVPIGFQLGVVRPIAGQMVRFAVNPQWNLKNIAGAVESNIIFTVALLLPGS